MFDLKTNEFTGKEIKFIDYQQNKYFLNEVMVNADNDKLFGKEIKFLDNQILGSADMVMGYSFLNRDVPSFRKNSYRDNNYTEQWINKCKEVVGGSVHYLDGKIQHLYHGDRSNRKYKDIYFVKNGGWHFSYLKKPKEIEKKLKSYLHHCDYDRNPLGVEKIKKIVDEKKPIYDLKVDQRKNKFEAENQLVRIKTDLMPSYLVDNLEKYKEWIDND